MRPCAAMTPASIAVCTQKVDRQLAPDGVRDYGESDEDEGDGGDAGRDARESSSSDFEERLVGDGDVGVGTADSGRSVSGWIVETIGAAIDDGGGSIVSCTHFPIWSRVLLRRNSTSADSPVFANPKAIIKYPMRLGFFRWSKPNS